MQDQISNYAQPSALATNKVLRNTYMLLSMTLAFSAICAGGAMAIGLGRGAALMMMIAAILLVWFVLPRTANSSAGLGVVFLFTGLLGASLGPTISAYLGVAGGAQIVLQALGGTAFIFLTLSAYVLTSKKDFSFMGGFLFVGLMVIVVASLGGLVASLMGVNVSVFSLAISGASVLLFSGFILYDTSRIINGGETNYIMATVSLYLSIYQIFVHLLHLLGAMNDD
ncbi:Bax inhibitor-1/YccA family protein [uncultured Umboniibacter sp.]|uniref:Bax inhibitor-1/YccA family protein n=1 Tax=uncultured Umboniibacter sp. TaxID=1798917 RepID=UPI00261B1E39|nr:Bax inhibitor-1/YccA family protein [uncultured Umboniibacter sp.]